MVVVKERKSLELRQSQASWQAGHGSICEQEVQ